MAAAPPVVLIVGCGLAGLMAAFEAGTTLQGGGARVIAIDKQSKGGGNSVRASSGLSASRTSWDTDNFYEDTMRSCGMLCNPDLVSKLVEGSTEVLPFLESIGVDLPFQHQLGGHSFSRTWAPRAGEPIGLHLYSRVEEKVKALPNVELRFGQKLVGIDLDEDTGAVVAASILKVPSLAGTLPKRVPCSAIVVASGGYAGNAEALMLNGAFDASRAGATSNGAQASGDALAAILASTPAAAVDLDQVQFHPTGFVGDLTQEGSTAGLKKSILCPEAWRGAGAILISPRTGRRFVDELGQRDLITAAINDQAGGSAWIVLPPDAVAAAEDAEATSGVATSILGEGFYERLGLAQRVPCSGGLAALAAAMEVPLSALDAEMGHYDALVEDASALSAFVDTTLVGPAVECPVTAKCVFPAPMVATTRSPTSSWVVARVQPVAHYCMGGLAIDTHARVLDGHRNPIPGLFACGEATGGIHGENRLAGNSLTECVVFGREAGRGAAEYAGAAACAGAALGLCSAAF